MPIQNVSPSLQPVILPSFPECIADKTDVLQKAVTLLASQNFIQLESWIDSFNSTKEKYCLYDKLWKAMHAADFPAGAIYELIDSPRVIAKMIELPEGKNNEELRYYSWMLACSRLLTISVVIALILKLPPPPFEDELHLMLA